MTTAASKPGQTTWWPAKVPTFAPTASPDVLRLAVGRLEPSLSPGQIVERGQTISPAAGGRPAVLSPCKARLGKRSKVLANKPAPYIIELTPITETADQTPAAVTLPDDDTFRKASSADIGPWIDRLRDAGVSANRTSSPDLIAQLNMALRRPVDTLICNGLDTDPTMRVQGALAATYPEDLEAGITLLRLCCQASRTCMVVEAWSPATWNVPVRKVLRGTPIKLVELANDYPEADSSLLVYTITRRKLRPGRLPVERATLLLDVAAAIAVGRVARGKRPLPVHIGLRDRAAGISHYLTALNGTPLNHILATTPVKRPHILRHGDLLRDRRLADDAAISVADERIIHICPIEAVVNPEPCIRCAWCVESCPTRVHPAMLLEAAQEHNLSRARWAGLDACIECGICVHVCPSQLPILDGIRYLKRLSEEPGEEAARRIPGGPGPDTDQ